MRQTIKMLVISLMVIVFCDSLMNGDSTAKGMDRNVIISEEQHAEGFYKTSPQSLQVYQSIKKYCKVYTVPEVYAFKVAYIESGWKGPHHKGYVANNKISSANALGAMQVLPSTACDVWKDESITEERLLNDIDFNVHTSIKYMKQLYNGQAHQDWAKVFAIYNTGYTTLNDYAISVVNHGNLNER